MLESGTDPESYITEYTLVYEEKRSAINCQTRSRLARRRGGTRNPGPNPNPGAHASIQYHSAPCSVIQHFANF